GTRDHLVAPKLLAVSRVMPGDIAAMTGHLAGTASDDHAIDDNRPGRILHVEIVVAAIALPHAAARLGIETDDVIIPGGEDDIVAVKRDGALALAKGSRKFVPRRQRVTIFPNKIASRSIDRLDHIAGITEIHDAVMDDRRNLVGSG